MKNSVHSPLRARNALAGGLVLLAALLLSTAATASAASPAYQSSPSFQCHAWNNHGECVSYSYFDDRAYAPARSYRFDDRPYNYRSTSRPYYDDRRPARGRLSVRVTGGPDPVRAGDTVTYNIYVKNDDARSAVFDVIAELDENTEFLSTSDSGRSYGGYGSYNRGDTVEWRNVNLRGNDSITFTLRARVLSQVRYGSDIQIRVRADGAEDTHSIEVRDPYRSDDCYDRYGRYDSTYCRGRDRRDDDCYDSYGRYDSSYCRNRRSGDCYDRYGRYDSSYCRDQGRYGRLNISIDDSRDPVRQDETFTYTITLRGDDYESRTVDVRALLDSYARFQSASGSPHRLTRQNEVTWESVYVPRNSSTTLSLTVRADASARDGTSLRLRVTADSSSDEETTQVRY